MSRMPSFLLILWVSLHIAPALASNWNEAEQGDLSNNGFAPSLLSLTPGSNLLTGEFRALDLDYLAVIVPDGYVLSGIVTGVGNNPGLSKSFIGFQSGPLMTVIPAATDASGLLGWTHFGGADGVNILPSMGIPKSGSTGFSGFLPSGAYTFWLNETSSDPGLTYDLDLRITPVPLPASLTLLISGLMSGKAISRRRHTSQGSYQNVSN